ncbi:MAG: hypothetical protein ACPGLV_10305 [Bacteroidia bacterium]
MIAALYNFKILLVVAGLLFMASFDKAPQDLNVSVQLASENTQNIVLDLIDVKGAEIKLYDPNGLLVYWNQTVESESLFKSINVKDHGVYWLSIKNNKTYLSLCVVVNQPKTMPGLVRGI